MPSYSGNKIDADLIPSNIKNGIDIFGVTGNYSPVPATMPGSTESGIINYSRSVGATGGTGLTPSPEANLGSITVGSIAYYFQMYGAGTNQYATGLRVTRFNNTTGVRLGRSESLTIDARSSGGSSFKASSKGVYYDSVGGRVIFRTEGWANLCTAGNRNHKTIYNIVANTFSYVRNDTTCVSDADPDFSFPALNPGLTQLVFGNTLSATTRNYGLLNNWAVFIQAKIH